MDKIKYNLFACWKLIGYLPIVLGYMVSAKRILWHLLLED